MTAADWIRLSWAWRNATGSETSTFPDSDRRSPAAAAQTAPVVVYCGTFTASGLKVEIKDGKLHILQEGKVKKFIKDVEQVTFAAEYAAEVGQKVLYITERAVFELIDGVLTLTEIAPGVDLEKDILAQMEFRPAIAEDLKEMDARIFRDEVMGLSA